MAGKPTVYGNRQSPEARAKAKSSEANKIRRRYKKNLTLSRKLLPGELPYVEDMVLVLKLAGYNNTQVGQVIGLSHTQVNEILGNPKVSEKMISLRAALPQAALDLMQGYMIEAVQTIVDVMRTELDNKLVLQAAGEILDRSGLSKASRQERHQINEQRTTLTDDGLIERLRAASPEVQEQAAQAIEALESLLTDKAEENPE